jgi:hypothetical protein
MQFGLTPKPLCEHRPSKPGAKNLRDPPQKNLHPKKGKIHGLRFHIVDVVDGKFGPHPLVPYVRPLETLALRSDLTAFYAVENNPHSQVSESFDLVFRPCGDK